MSSLWEQVEQSIQYGEKPLNTYGVDNSSTVLKKLFFSDEYLNEWFLHDDEIIFKSNSEMYRVQSFQSRIEKSPFRSEKELSLYTKYLVQRCELQCNYTHPFQSFTLILATMVLRVTITHASLSPTKKVFLSLRKVSHHPFSLNDFGVQNESLKLVQEQRNIIVWGATGCGKTSYLKSLMQQIPRNENCIVLEDTMELFIKDSHHTYLTPQNNSNTSLRELCAFSMRMRPDRLILGEIRSDEIIPYLLSLTNGHKGLLTTIHASSSQGALERLLLLYSLYHNGHGHNPHDLLKLICMECDYLVGMKKGKISTIDKCLGSDQGIPFLKNIYSEVSA